MNYFLGFLFILILLFLIHNFSKKRKLKKYKEYLHTNWGKEKKKEYYNFFIIGKYFTNTPSISGDNDAELEEALDTIPLKQGW